MVNEVKFTMEEVGLPQWHIPDYEKGEIKNKCGNFFEVLRNFGDFLKSDKFFRNLSKSWKI